MASKTSKTSKTSPARSTRSTKSASTEKVDATPIPKVKKSDQVEAERDWTYLADKMPTDLHEDMAAFIIDKVGLEVDAEQMADFVKAVQCTAVLRMVYQRSDRNKARESYRALQAETVEQRSIHMVQAHTDAQAAIAERQAKEEARKQATRAAAAKRRAAKKAAAPAPVEAATA